MLTNVPNNECSNASSRFPHSGPGAERCVSHDLAEELTHRPGSVGRAADHFGRPGREGRAGLRPLPDRFASRCRRQSNRAHEQRRGEVADVDVIARPPRTANVTWVHGVYPHRRTTGPHLNVVAGAQVVLNRNHGQSPPAGLTTAGWK